MSFYLSVDELQEVPAAEGSSRGTQAFNSPQALEGPSDETSALGPSQMGEVRCSPFHCLPSPGIQLRQGQHDAFMPVLPAL